MLVDTNVLVDIVENDLDWAEWSIMFFRIFLLGLTRRCPAYPF